MIESNYPFIETVARALAFDDLGEEDDWEAYVSLAMTSIRTIKEWFESRKPD